MATLRPRILPVEAMVTPIFRLLVGAALLALSPAMPARDTASDTRPPPTPDPVVVDSKQPGPVTVERVLPNGMKVLVREDRRSPTVVHLVLYRIGSFDEINGLTGVSHALEHMMFKGTKTLGVGEFSRRVAERGGRENAFTSRDYTGYFQQIHRDHLPEMMKLEADRMANLVVDDAELESATEALASRIATKSPVGLRRMKRLVNDGLEQPAGTALRMELLASEAYAPWAVAERQRFGHEVHLAAIRAAGTAAALGDWSEAQRWASRAIELERIDESAWRILMRAHQGSGRRSEALRCYFELRAFLSDELGSDPSPETSQLYLELLRADDTGTQMLDAREELRGLVALMRRTVSSLPGVQVPGEDRALVAMAVDLIGVS